MNPKISLHAIRRYAERVSGIELGERGDTDAIVFLRDQGLNIDALKRKLEERLFPGIEMGATRISVDGVTACILEGCVTTFVPGKSPSSSYMKSRKAKGRSTKVIRNRR